MVSIEEDAHGKRQATKRFVALGGMIDLLPQLQGQLSNPSTHKVPSGFSTPNSNRNDGHVPLA